MPWNTQIQCCDIHVIIASSQLGQQVATGDVIPNVSTYTGAYHNMDVTIAKVLVCERSVSIVKTELAQLR